MFNLRFFAKMAVKFEIGDLVWARMKGFPAWPGKIMEPKPDIKRPSEKKPLKQFVFFFGSENYAWIPEDNIWHYAEHKEKFSNLTQRMPKGYKEALTAIEELANSAPPRKDKVIASPSTLPSIDDDVAAIFANDSKENVGQDSTKKKKSEVSETNGSESATRKSVEQKRKSIPVKSEQRRSENKPSMNSIASSSKKRPALFGALSAASASKRHKMLVKVSNSPQGGGGVRKNFTTMRKNGEGMKAFEFGEDGEDASYSSPRITEHYTPTATRIIDSQVSPKHIIPTPMKIGFLGLGTMGTGMVNNLLVSGHEVTVWNRTPSKCKNFMKDGALKANSPSEVVQLCDITFSCISDPMALKDLVFGTSGVLQGITQGKSFVDMSTVDLETITDVHDAVTARGGRFLEAPVIGSKDSSEEGQLIILASGDRTLYDDCCSCFQAMSKKMFYLGEVGSATKLKLVLSLLSGTVLAGLAESMALAQKMGLDQEEMMRILDISTVSCPLITAHGRAMLLSQFSEPNCKLQLAQKDIRLAVNMSETVDQPLHVGSAVNELFKKAKAKGYGEHDAAAIYRAADL